MLDQALGHPRCRLAGRAARVEGAQQNRRGTHRCCRRRSPSGNTARARQPAPPTLPWPVATIDLKAQDCGGSTFAHPAKSLGADREAVRERHGWGWHSPRFVL